MSAQLLLSSPVSRLATATSVPDMLAPKAAAPQTAAPQTAAPQGSAAGASLLAPVTPAASPPATPGAPAAAPADAPASTQPLRLTRRGRLVFIGLPIMLTAAAALTVLGFFTAPAVASSGAPDVTETLQVSVDAGDSLWGLAEEFVPDRDPRDVVADIMELNNLSDARVSAGVQLFIPIQH